MLEKTFEIDTAGGKIHLSCRASRGVGTATVKLKMCCPETMELSVFEAKKLAKGILDTVDVGSMI